MNKTTKAIVYGIGSCALTLVLVVAIRALIKGEPFVDGFKEWSNWVVSVICGVSSAYSTLTKDKKDKQDKA